MHNFPILIVGMARSGTTLVSHVLGSLPNVHIEVEPHALWRSGNFKYLNDEEFDITDKIVNNIRKKLTQHLNGETIIEKSPINSLRPDLVHAVFPEAKIVYIERDPVRCIYSNYVRSVNKDSFKLSIILKKYFVYTGSEDLSGAISDRKLFQQISLSDLPKFFRYTTIMFNLRRTGNLPFGPKLKNFTQIVKTKGMLAYHAEVYKKSVEYKQRYKQLYGDNMHVFKMEKIMEGKDEIERLINFTQMPFTQKWRQEIHQTFDKERVEKANKQKDIDHKILELIA
ncbi:MAG: sulfotransferase family protein [Chitinophagaceae bacterium]